MPALEFHAVARNRGEGVVRAKVARDGVVASEVVEAALFRICGIEVRTVSKLLRSQRGLIQQNACRTDAGQFLLLLHAFRDFASLSLRPDGSQAHYDEEQKREN